MDRRTALKNLTMSMGYAVAAPTLVSILSSCTTEVSTWEPVFFTAEEKKMVIQLVDVIIPESAVVGGLDVNIPQFMDLMFKDIEKESNQKLFRNGAQLFATRFKEKFGISVLDGKKDEFEELLTQYFNLSESKSKEILRFQKKPIDKVLRDKKDIYNVYKFLLFVRYYSIYGYCTSEKVGEEVLSYDPIPGDYKGCISVEEVGNAWSL
ncbi:gluconate 2-dehydrogenase subunit 3 family protein [Flavicella sp.]|uniref:gluconate 2-dehydrogenase subunit 3 family protein n=1 Tax=Flavicella sp. TaxID=2957742 RepID=UPI0030190B60